MAGELQDSEVMYGLGKLLTRWSDRCVVLVLLISTIHIQVYGLEKMMQGQGLIAPSLLGVKYIQIPIYLQLCIQA